jgi:adenylate kinase
MLNIVLFGPPGAGKGTQSEKLIEHFNLMHLSTGDLLRAERKAGTDLGVQANAYIEKGELVPDAIVIGMVRKKILDNTTVNGFVFDGFPRTIAQGIALDRMLEAIDYEITMMISMEVDEEELVARLLNRGKTSGRSDDQDEKTIRNRFQVYLNETEPLKTYYQSQKKLRTIDGIGTIDEIFNRICNAIDG